jgi:hypothetical protein
MVGEMTWSSSASPVRVIQSFTQVSKDGWRDDMELFCITCKSNPFLHSGEKEDWKHDIEVFYITYKSNPFLHSGEKVGLQRRHSGLLQEQSTPPCR